MIVCSGNLCQIVGTDNQGSSGTVGFSVDYRGTPTLAATIPIRRKIKIGSDDQVLPVVSIRWHHVELRISWIHCQNSRLNRWIGLIS
jgi:hypothetical protein